MVVHEREGAPLLHRCLSNHHFVFRNRNCPPAKARDMCCGAEPCNQQVPTTGATIQSGTRVSCKGNPTVACSAADFRISLSSVTRPDAQQSRSKRAEITLETLFTSQTGHCRIQGSRYSPSVCHEFLAAIRVQIVQKMIIWACSRDERACDRLRNTHERSFVILHSCCHAPATVGTYTSIVKTSSPLRLIVGREVPDLRYQTETRGSAHRLPVSARLRGCVVRNLQNRTSGNYHHIHGPLDL